jgi:L-amino acid N-acyltransferase YncA
VSARGYSVVPAPRRVLAWLEQRVGVALSPSARGIAVVSASGDIRGMAAYDGWTDSSVQAHVAVESPAAWRALVRPAFEYPFLQAGRLVLLGLIRGGNAASLRVAQHLGFRLVHRVRDGAAPGEDLVLVEMRREECRWLESGPRARSRRNERRAA